MIGKYSICLTVSVLFITVNGSCNVENMEPGQCLSRFDYDYRIMQKMLQVETLVKDLNLQVESQAREIRKLKEVNTETQLIAFMAQLSASMVNPATGTMVVFDAVLTNVGNSYNAGSGIFVVPVNGTYSINLVATSAGIAGSNKLQLYIMHNSSQVGYVFLDDVEHSLLRSTTAVLELKSGDTVFVKIGNIRGSGTLVGCCFHTHFSGFLIKAG